MPIAGPGMALESTKGWSEVSRGVWNAEARQNVSKRQGGVFPIWNRMRSVIPGSMGARQAAEKVEEGAGSGSAALQRRVGC